MSEVKPPAPLKPVWPVRREERPLRQAPAPRRERDAGERQQEDDGELAPARIDDFA